MVGGLLGYFTTALATNWWTLVRVLIAMLRPHAVAWHMWRLLNAASATQGCMGPPCRPINLPLAHPPICPPAILPSPSPSEPQQATETDDIFLAVAAAGASALAVLAGTRCWVVEFRGGFNSWDEVVAVIQPDCPSYLSALGGQKWWDLTRLPALRHCLQSR